VEVAAAEISGTRALAVYGSLPPTLAHRTRKDGAPSAVPGYAFLFREVVGRTKCTGPFDKLRAGSSSGILRFAKDSASSG
jgi:hypothetical protein